MELIKNIGRTSVKNSIAYMYDMYAFTKNEVCVLLSGYKVWIKGSDPTTLTTLGAVHKHL